MSLRHVMETNGNLISKPVRSAPQKWTPEDIIRWCRTMKEIGHSSCVNIPISVAERMADDARKYRELMG